ncbi:MAG: flgA [Paucimonas sp.]|jgi:flagella basal body P-ring formation protein FlgA|nr:flgA [Paucimonas sp.]
MAFFRLFLVCLLACTSVGARAQTVPARQDASAVKRIAEEFLLANTAGLTGEVKVEVNPVDSRLNLAACISPDAFMPSNSRPWGRTTVGVRCTAPANWTIYLSANIRVKGDYFVTAVPLAQGKTLEAGDLQKATGEISGMAPGIVTNASQATGRVLTTSLKAGTPLRQDMLKNQQAVLQGQTVKVIAGGPSFQVTAEAKALTNAAIGQVAQARTENGQLISGIAKAGGIIEVVN